MIEKARRRPAGDERIQVTVEHTVRADDPLRALQCLAALTTLSNQRLKDAMNKGAVWLTRRGRRPQRLRRVTAELTPGDRIALYYDAGVLAMQPQLPTLLTDYKRYSAWYKPAGLLVDGSRYGDHCTLERQVEQHFGGRRQVFLVHRLDREAAGVMLVAHSSQSAARLGALFHDRRVEKYYEIEVRGQVGPAGATGRIDEPLDGKPAHTEYAVLAVDGDRDVSRLQVRIHTGRYHQIRRHFAGLGHPVMGDPKYGENNSDPRGMQLVASRLSFICPWSGQPVTVTAAAVQSRG
jgi:tRNA pseudouridine32 synthase/23S rRNA pseudouridine746 synthase